ncbi:MAG: short-chain fatty acyl-CoA regulator family protein [Silicimonas sp.]|nr:short-chain fatty acyl-CoA regulator family protein [Silicimonas sp.]
MAETLHAGTRIRDRRNARGLRQAELARICEISPSYLNLIEHNRRRIGGALLLRIASALETDPAALSEGAESTLTSALDAAASAHGAIATERDRIEEMATRFPGWARLIAAQHGEAQRLEQVVERLDDRLTHDPFLSASMHNVLTSVTAIRSASGILASGETLEPEWQARFHRNIYEDSQRLADATETLVGYLDSDAATGERGSLPQEDLEHWLASRNWRISELEGRGGDHDRILARATELQTPAARDLARRFLTRYEADARQLPEARLREALQDGAKPGRIATALDIPLPVVFRRLATLEPGAFASTRPFGLVGCDASGTLIFRKPIPGFEPPRYGGACPLWPLFRALQQPMVLFDETLTIGGRDRLSFDVQALAEVHYPAGYSEPAALTSWMLIRDSARGDSAREAIPAGITCRVCAETNCPTRREPSVFAEISSTAL